MVLVETADSEETAENKAEVVVVEVAEGIAEDTVGGFKGNGRHREVSAKRGGNFAFRLSYNRPERRSKTWDNRERGGPTTDTGRSANRPEATHAHSPPP